MSTVTFFDIGLALVMLLAAFGGSRLGLLTRVWSWLGLGIGLVVATRVAGPAVAPLEDQDAFVRLIATLMVVMICAGVGQSIGFTIGNRLRRGLPDSLQTADRVAGAVTGVVAVLAVVWLLLPTLTMMQGTLARLARGSVIVAAVDQYSPPVPASVRDLGQEVSGFDFPEVFDDLRVAPEVGPPPETLGLPVEVVDRVRLSTMNIEARGCGGTGEGSGFVVENELVATNAHVVAGGESFQVVFDDGRSRLDAELVAINTGTDLALLRVPGLTRPLAPPGYGRRRCSRRRCSAILAARTSSASRLPRSPTARPPSGATSTTATWLAVRSSSWPPTFARAIRAVPWSIHQASVVGVLFALAPDRPSTAYALDVIELQRLLAAQRSAQTSSGALQIGPAGRRSGPVGPHRRHDLLHETQDRFCGLGVSEVHHEMADPEVVLVLQQLQQLRRVGVGLG